MAVSLKSVLISDPVDERCAALLTRHGVAVTTKYKLPHDELIRELQNHDGLIVRSETKVTAQIIAAVPNLKIIGRAGTGVDNIDIPKATENGVLVLNTPGGNSISACELTCTMISSLARNVPQAAQSMKEGRWDRKLYAGRELQNKVLGVVGFGRIGREVAQRMQSYGMKIVAYDPFLTLEQAVTLNVTKGELEDIWKNSDYITVHTPLMKETKNLVNSETLNKCKKGVYVVNVARGGIVDEDALLQAIKTGQCGGAGLDVFTEEPPVNKSLIELIRHPKVIATPHLGASTAEAQTRVAIEIAEQFLAVAGISNEFPITGIVNSPASAAAANPNNVAWVELARRLGKVANKLIKHSPPFKVSSTTEGSSLADKQFLHKAILVGLLHNSLDIGINLVNAPHIADKVNVAVHQSHENDKKIPSLVINTGKHIVKGTVSGNATLLLSIDDVVFPGGLFIEDNVSLYYGDNPQSLASKIFAAHVTQHVTINNISFAGKWIVVQTDRFPTVQIPNIQSF